MIYFLIHEIGGQHDSSVPSPTLLQFSFMPEAQLQFWGLRYWVHVFARWEGIGG